MIFAVYKPKGITSNALLNKLRRAAGTKKIGHAGTLDPLAEGVLVVGVGRDATKRLPEEVAKEKEYIATIRLGMTSATDDEEGEKTLGVPVTTWRPGRHVDASEVRDVVTSFVGNIQQTPPLYSAVKVQGKEAYIYARAGRRVDIKPRSVIIKEIEVMEYEWPFLKLRAVTGPGVYIRSLARDIGEELGVGGYLAGLVRTRVGQWNIERTVSLDEALRKVVK